MALSGILGWLNIQGLHVRIDLPDEIYSGHDTFITVRLGNSKRHLPSFLLRMKVGGRTIDFPILDREGEETGSLTMTFPERGSRNLGVVEICSPFPVNFFVRCTRVSLGRHFLVFPAPLPCPLPASFARVEEKGGRTTASKGYEGEMAKIADYTGGEPLKLIHWRLSARHGGLKVKELTATAQDPVIIDITSQEGLPLESRLSCAAFLINRLIRSQRPVGMRLRDRIIAPASTRAHRLRLLSELAVYDRD